MEIAGELYIEQTKGKTGNSTVKILIFKDHFIFKGILFPDRHSKGNFIGGGEGEKRKLNNDFMIC